MMCGVVVLVRSMGDDRNMSVTLLKQGRLLHSCQHGHAPVTYRMALGRVFDYLFVFIPNFGEE